ncbi:hypothetical protein SEA_RASPUTIA_90 [Microbacterium phage Rasputia]|nr:hypothetical protein SEA_RASPUTIA_90 [Microbacterium phage Rasputia]
MDAEEYQRRQDELRVQRAAEREERKARRRAAAEAEAAAEALRVREDAAKRFLAEAHAHGRSDPHTAVFVQMMERKTAFESLLYMDVMVFFMTAAMIRIYKMQNPDD